MGSKAAKRSYAVHAVNKRQGGLVAYTWSDFLPEDVGNVVQVAMAYGRGVLLGSSPSGELLVMRIYHAEGFTPIYGRSLAELVERIHKVFSTIVLPPSSVVPVALNPKRAPEYGSVGYLVEHCGWAEAQARAFASKAEETRAWARRTPILEVAKRISRFPPPPL